MYDVHFMIQNIECPNQMLTTSGLKDYRYINKGLVLGLDAYKKTDTLFHPLGKPSLKKIAEFDLEPHTHPPEWKNKAFVMTQKLQRLKGRIFNLKKICLSIILSTHFQTML